MPSSFFAYPSQPQDLVEPIRNALQILRDEFRNFNFHSWEETDVAGRFIIGPILTEIDNCDFLAADITRLNFNVTYEIGYAIGRRRRLFLTRNSSLLSDDSLMREVGVFDTIGYKDYQDGRYLATLLTNVTDFRALQVPQVEVNKQAPVYVLLPKVKTDREIHLLSRVKKAKLRFRSFDPDEQVRLSAFEAINNIATSYGVIVPLIPSARKDALVHNIRAAFVAGLAHALEKELLLLQFGDDPIPIDYRDLVQHVPRPQRVDDCVGEFASSIVSLLQSGVAPAVGEVATFLAKLNVGAPAAENEISDLAEYYLETDEYRRVLRGEIQIVAGRKGSGKSALFFRVRDKVRSTRQNLVLDLKPESFQLRKFKDVVLAYLEQGTKEHTIVAFWEYLLLLEVCHKILDQDKDLHITNNKLFQPYRDLAKEYRSDEYVSEGDFAERMLKLTERIMEDFGGVLGTHKGATRLSNQELTELLYKHDTHQLRERISSYLDNKRELWILFDNLDKGWPPRGLDDEDVLILRCLIDAISKLKKYLSKRDTVCYGVVFLRNDVYELLVENTTDRGKTSRVMLDWTDPEYLRELLRRRLVSNNLNPLTKFEDIWRQICISHVGSEESASYLIDRCLMRPRSLIELVSHCRSHAVNLNRSRMELEDVKEGEESYSSELVENVGLEMRDIFPGIEPSVKNVLYEFIGSPARLSQPEVLSILEKYGIPKELCSKLIDLLLWWGFFGVVREGENAAYIYSVQYNMDHLRALVRKSTHEPIYQINPAFWAGLEVSPGHE